MYFVNPKDEERFYLRAILSGTLGCTNFKDCRTINEIVYPTFKEAARQLGLVDDDKECDACLSEAITFKNPFKLRHLFASIIVYCQPANLKELWDKYVDNLIEDYIYHGDTKELAITKTIIFIEKYLIQNGLELLNFPELPKINYHLLEENQQQTLIADEENYDQEEIDQTLNNLNSLNSDQKLIFDTVINAINGKINQKLFFVDKPEGTKKTFLYNMILAHVRSSSSLNGIAIAVASSGIAALLMNRGRTAHS